MKSPFGRLLFALPILLTLASHARADLITNGSFEAITGTLPTGGVCTNSTSIFSFSACAATGWTGTYQIGNGLGTGNGSSFYIPQPDPNGSNALILQTYFNVVSSNAEQTITIPTAGSYDLSFFAADRTAGAGGAGPQTLYVSWDGSVLAGGTYANLPAGWTQETLDISTTSGNHTLMFSGLSKPQPFDASAFIDKVSLTAVPEIDATSGASAIALLVGVLLMVRGRRTTTSALIGNHLMRPCGECPLPMVSKEFPS